MTLDDGQQIRLTMALDQSSSPPIGAKMMPTAKKSGRTVLGVRMGLKRVNIPFTSLHSGYHILPCFQSLLAEGRVCKAQRGEFAKSISGP